MIKTKQAFYRKFYRGLFGNTSPYWGTLEEYQAAKYRGLIAIRVKVPNGRCDYFIKPSEVVNRIKSFLADGYSLSDLNYSAQCPEHDKLVQGEVQLTPNGLYLFGSTNKQLAMRQALKRDSFSLYGLAAHMFLKSRMCCNSWEWLQELFVLYPGHVVEFTTLRYCWGNTPGFNTLFWEVRGY